METLQELAKSFVETLEDASSNRPAAQATTKSG